MKLRKELFCTEFEDLQFSLYAYWLHNVDSVRIISEPLKFAPFSTPFPEFSKFLTIYVYFIRMNASTKIQFAPISSFCFTLLLIGLYLAISRICDDELCHITKHLSTTCAYTMLYMTFVINCSHYIFLSLLTFGFWKIIFLYQTMFRDNTQEMRWSIIILTVRSAHIHMNRIENIKENTTKKFKAKPSP